LAEGKSLKSWGPTINKKKWSLFFYRQLQARLRKMAGRSFSESIATDPPRPKHPPLRQQRLNRRPEPHRHKSLRAELRRQFFVAVHDSPAIR
jgi:hypothetical protein